jgi:hypothetical protein
MSFALGFLIGLGVGVIGAAIWNFSGGLAKWE